MKVPTITMLPGLIELGSVLWDERDGLQGVVVETEMGLAIYASTEGDGHLHHLDDDEDWALDLRERSSVDLLRTWVASRCGLPVGLGDSLVFERAPNAPDRSWRIISYPEFAVCFFSPIPCPDAVYLRGVIPELAAISDPIEALIAVANMLAKRVAPPASLEMVDSGFQSTLENIPSEGGYRPASKLMEVVELEEDPPCPEDRLPEAHRLRCEIARLKRTQGLLEEDPAIQELRLQLDIVEGVP